jgi:hypothetical protein
VEKKTIEEIASYIADVATPDGVADVCSRALKSAGYSVEYTRTTTGSRVLRVKTIGGEAFHMVITRARK